MSDASTTSPVLSELEKAQADEKIPKYSEEEKKYLAGLQIRLERARNDREQKHDEFDGMAYSEYFESNEKGANTYVEPKKNKEDSNYSSGTIRGKLFVFLAERASKEMELKAKNSMASPRRQSLHSSKSYFKSKISRLG
jgi:hypothetical protein